MPQGRKKSNTIKVNRKNFFGQSQNDIRVTDVDGDVFSGSCIGDHQVGCEDSVVTDMANLNADQMFALGMLKASDIRPEEVTQKVLKMCNVVRERQDVLGKGAEFMRKRTGTGGCGGRRHVADL